MTWNLDNNIPIYLQIMERIQRDIISGRYRPGDKLPSVRELAVEAAVNPNTMQRRYPSWNEEAWYTPSEPADDLLRRMKNC